MNKTLIRIKPSSSFFIDNLNVSNKIRRRNICHRNYEFFFCNNKTKGIIQRPNAIMTSMIFSAQTKDVENKNPYKVTHAGPNDGPNLEGRKII